MKSKRKNTVYYVLSLLGLVAVVLVSQIRGNTFDNSRTVIQAEERITLDNSNQPTTATDYEDRVIYTGIEYATYTYTKVKHTPGALATLNQGGTLEKDQAKGLTEFRAVFTGKLRLETWFYSTNEESVIYDLVDDVRLNIVGNYFRLVAEEVTTIYSITISYLCTTAKTPSESILVSDAEISNKAAIFSPNVALNASKTMELAIAAKNEKNEDLELNALAAIEFGLITIQSTNATVVEIDGVTAKAVATGTSTIEVKSGTGTTLDTVEVTVVDRVAGQLSLRLSNDDNQRARQGDIMTLPTVKAYDKDGHDVTSQVEITDSLGETVSVTNENFSSNIVGIHVLTYKLDIDGELIEKVINREVYQRVLGDGGARNDVVVVDEDKANPYVTTSNKGIGLRDFYVPLSKQYYAEWTWSSANGTSGGHIIAGAHFSDEELNPEYAPFTYMGYKLNGEYSELAHGKTVNGWNVEEPRMWSATSLIKAKDLDGLDPKTTAWKMAVARDGDAMYYFINDKLINVDYNPDFFNKDTKPGFMVKGNDISAPNVTLNNFANETGTEAVDKIKTLIGGSIFDYYTLYDLSKEKNYATFAENGFTYIEQLAIDNMDNMNATMVAPYALLNGNFAMSFDIQGGRRGDNDGWGKIMFDLRTFQDKKTALMMSLASGGDNNYYEGVIDSSEVGGQYKNIFSEITSVIGTMGAKEKYTITISLEVTTSNVEKYTITILNTNNPSNVATVDYELTYTGEYQYLVGGPKLLVFHSQKWSGTVSNFQIAY